MKSTGKRVPVVAPNPVVTIHRLYRGRYLFAALMAMVFAGVLAPIGYKVANPRFSSSGMVRVSPVLPKILYGNEDNEQLPQFDSYLVGQIQLISSRPVLEKAVKDPALLALGWPEGPAGVAALSRSLSVVKGGPRSELIEISVSNEKPLLATQAVNSVLDAVVARNDARHDETSSLRESTLDQRLKVLREELAAAETKLLAAAGEYGPDNLDRVHTAKVIDIERLDGKIQDLENNIAEQEAKRQSEVASEESDDEVKRLTIADHAMANLLLRRADKSVELGNAERVYGKTHFRYQAAKAALDMVERSIQDRIEQLATLGKTGVLTAQKAVAGDEKTIGQLRTLKDNMVVMRSKAAEVSMSLGERRFEVALLQSRRTELLNGIEDTQRRLDQVRVESRAPLPGRVSVAVRGMVPVAPSDDKRKVMAAGGGMAGVLAGLLLAVLDRVVRPRFRRVDELGSILNADGVPVPLMGVLPHVSRGRQVQSAAARRQVALLRSALETGLSAGDGKALEPGTAPVVVVTSASESEGKTNVALALARGCAASGQRTLLIDGDLNRRGLTELLCLSSRPGVLDAIRVASPMEMSLAEDRPNLSVLPAGSTDDLFGESMSQAQLAAMVDDYRKRFDLIIVDSDSCLTSAGTQLFASLAQQVLLVVQRNQLQSRVRMAVDRLGRVCTASVGIVLNRAEKSDLAAASQVENRRDGKTMFALEVQSKQAILS